MTIENLSKEAEMQDAIKIRRGAKATIVNALVKGSGLVTDLVDLKDGKGNADTTTTISVSKELSQATANDVNGTGNVTVANGNTGVSTDTFAWTGYKF